MVFYEVNPILEAFSYFTGRINKKTIKINYQNLLAEKEKSGEALAKLIKPYFELEKYIDKKIETNERHEFFFQALEGELLKINELTLATLITPTPSPCLHVSLDEAFEAVKRTSEEEMRYDIMLALNPWEMMKRPRENAVAVDEYFKFIGNLQYSPEVKWKLADLYNHYYTYVDELKELLRPVVNIFVEHAELYEQPMEDFKKKYPENTDVFALYEALSIKLTQNPNDKRYKDAKITLYPYLMGFSNISLYTPTLYRDKDSYDMYLGPLYFEMTSTTGSKKEHYKKDMPKTLRAICDKNPFDILCYLNKHAAYGVEIAEHFDIPTTTVSRYMAKLCESRLVDSRIDGNRIYYSLNKQNAKAMLNALKEFILGK